MKKHTLILMFFLLGSLLIGCSTKTNTEIKKEVSEKKVVNKEIPKKEVEIVIKAQKGTPEWTFENLVKAVEENNQTDFMKFQNMKNEVFFKEQQRWIDEVIYKKDHGFKISISFNSFQQENDSKGTVVFSVQMDDQINGSKTNAVTYECIKDGDAWLLNDVPFKTISDKSNNITVYYTGNQTEAAETMLTDAKDIVVFYSDNFHWKPNPISIKIYSSDDEASATVPFMQLSGWNETGESLKISTEQQPISSVFSILAHELTHKMLSDLSNDNASLYLQEGFATYLQNRVQRDKAGAIHFDQTVVEEKAKKAIEISKSVLSIEELGKIDYLDVEAAFSLYRDGSLISNYLVLTYGLDKYLEMLNYLSKFDYIDKRSEHKLDILNKRTVEALEKIYGSTKELSAAYKDFYLK
ncbi:M1 family aminopeptidase [Bacillus sp. S/N-304-OC-R1]|uniref:M1 family aminopeptidase n=1 Tax=Bacillus sp. S/N-304-OC-R1 TaxID=2758034 RepID=UPI001C8D1096|nr:M1 family aminopeptidase [Bacillus sp. S/N-304-OC-R1]MBY0122877.1 hypothetical protein [Bacillus sp. S/N-304-OC-R1]